MVKPEVLLPINVPNPVKAPLTVKVLSPPILSVAPVAILTFPIDLEISKTG